MIKSSKTHDNYIKLTKNEENIIGGNYGGEDSELLEDLMRKKLSILPKLPQNTEFGETLPPKFSHSENPLKNIIQSSVEVLIVTYPSKSRPVGINGSLCICILLCIANYRQGS